MAIFSNSVLMFCYDAMPKTITLRQHSSYCGITTHMGHFPDTQNRGLRMCRECRERFPRQRGLAIPTCITVRA